MAGAPAPGWPRWSRPRTALRPTRPTSRASRRAAAGTWTEATSAFRRAVRRGPAFALAYYELSQALSGGATPNPDGDVHVGYADSALRYAANSPPRERALLEGYHALMHADLPRARTTLQALSPHGLAHADAWYWLGFASQYDLTLRRDAAGREVMPADFTQRHALLHPRHRARRHRIIASTCSSRSCCSLAGLRDAQGLPAFREPPPNNFQSVLPPPAGALLPPLLRGESCWRSCRSTRSRRCSPAAARFPAHGRPAIAPGSSCAGGSRWRPTRATAYLMLAGLEFADKSYDSALRAIGKAESLGRPSPRRRCRCSGSAC